MGAPPAANQSDLGAEVIRFNGTFVLIRYGTTNTGTLPFTRTSDV